MKRLVFILCIFLIGVSVTALSYDKPLRNKVLDFGACENDLDSHLDDGYYQGSNETVCLVHPEVL